MTEPKKEENATYSLVSTTKATYFGIAEPTPKGVSVKYAIVVGDDWSTADRAREYISAELAGTYKKNVRVSEGQVESIEDAVEETDLINLYHRLLPEAQKRAVADITLDKLEEMVGAYKREDE